MVRVVPRIERKVRKITLIISTVLAILVVLFAYSVFRETTVFDEFLFFALVIVIFPSAILSYLDYKWRRSIDEHLPHLFRSVVQAQETGMTLYQALEEAANRDYGSLTAELKKMTDQISWGMSFEDALLALGRRIDTVLVRRTLPMIIEAGRSGGRVEKVFDPMGRFIHSTLLLDKERQTQTRPYIAIIYVSFFVFLFTIILLFKSFFVSLEQAPILGTAFMTAEETKRMFFHMTSIQAFFGGLVAGKMGNGTVNAGMKHSLILMICGYLILKLFL